MAEIGEHTSLLTEQNITTKKVQPLNKIKV